jgi:branched-subunit amino acid transport protein
MMSEWQAVAVIAALGAVTYALRAGGFLLGGLLPQAGLLPRLLRLAPGNLLAAYTAAGIWEGGVPSLCGSLVSMAVMAVTRREWAALGAGFAAAAASAALTR